MVTLTARLEKRDLGSGIRDVQKVIDQTTFPLSTSYEIGGQYESQQTSFRQLLYVLGLALGAVFAILVIQFRSFAPALIILSAAPLSLVGVFAMLKITGTALNVSSFMGIILMVGLVVKNRNHSVRNTFTNCGKNDQLPLNRSPRRCRKNPHASDSDDHAGHGCSDSCLSRSASAPARNCRSR